MFPNDVNEADVEKYMNGIRRAQLDLDIEPEKYKHFYLNEIPERYRTLLDVRRFSPGERIVFLPYTDTTFARTQAWLHERKLFDVQASLVAWLGSSAGRCSGRRASKLRYLRPGLNENGAPDQGRRA